MKLDITRLSHLVVVDRLRNFSRAAEELNITQPALSRSIAATERQFGIRVFERGRGGVMPTPLGEQVLAEARALLRQADNLQHNIGLYGTGKAGRIAFGMGALVAALTGAALGRDMLAQRPGLQMRIVTKAPAILQQELLDHQVELYFCGSVLVPQRADIVVTSVGSADIAMVARSGHPLAGRGGVMRSDLAAFPIACSNELHVDGGNGALICDNYLILRDAVLGSDAIWVSSPQLVGAELAAGTLIEIPVVDWHTNRTEIVAVSLQGRAMSPAGEAIVAGVQNILGRLAAA